MAYTKTNWVNETTPLNDTNMNKIENALENLDTNISKSTDEYSSTRTYSIGELVIYNNKLYKANQDITTAEAFNSSHWTEVTLLSDVNEIKSVVNNNADNLNKMDEVINAKQDKLTAGTNITISNNTISAKDTTYSTATSSIDGLMSKNDKSKLDNIFNSIYPVGSIYMSVNNTNPEILFGGTWKQIKDKFLLSAGDTYNAGDEGGEATHILTINELPKNSMKIPHVAYYDDCSISGGGWKQIGREQTEKEGVSQSNTTNGWHIMSIGNNEAHNNMPPYLAVYIWQRTA